MNIIAEKDGSFTINVNGGTVSTRNFGMVGKSYKTASEAFKDASYANPIELPEKAEYDHIWAIFGVLAAIGLVCFVISRW